MENTLAMHCPVCSNNSKAIRLSCKECDLELTNNFGLDKFAHLSVDELDFVKTFLKYRGSLKAVQQKKGMSYPAVKRRISEIVEKLGIEDIKNEKEVMTEMSAVNFLHIESSDSPVVTRIKERLNACGGRTTIKLLQGDPCEIWFDASGKGLVSPKIPPANQLVWKAFDAAVEVVYQNGGKAVKGKARSGAKLGSTDLPFNSVSGYIAHKVHGAQEGETAFGPGFVIAAVLDWADICCNKRGYLIINPSFVSEMK
jgi:hypothetical protein